MGRCRRRRKAAARHAGGAVALPAPCAQPCGCMHGCACATPVRSCMARQPRVPLAGADRCVLAQASERRSLNPSSARKLNTWLSTV